MDNLIASAKAKPMSEVMPAGYTLPIFVRRRPLDTSDFEKDLESDPLPYRESHDRVIADRQHCAIALLSMGGMHTRSSPSLT